MGFPCHLVFYTGVCTVKKTKSTPNRVILTHKEKLLKSFLCLICSPDFSRLSVTHLHNSGIRVASFGTYSPKYLSHEQSTPNVLVSGTKSKRMNLHGIWRPSELFSVWCNIQRGKLQTLLCVLCAQKGFYVEWELDHSKFGFSGGEALNRLELKSISDRRWEEEVQHVRKIMRKAFILFVIFSSRSPTYNYRPFKK